MKSLLHSINMTTKIEWMPDWRVSSAVLSTLGIWNGSEFITTIIGIFWASVAFAVTIKHFDFSKRYRKQSKLFFIIYFACMSSLVTVPAMAQEEATTCSDVGLFAGIGQFFTTTFANIALGQTTGGISSLLCQVLGIFTIVLLFLFLGAAGFSAYQVSFNNQPLTTVITPFMGFVAFALVATAIITVFIGSGDGGEVFGPAS